MSLSTGLKLLSASRVAFDYYLESPTVERRTALLQTIVDLEHQVSNGLATLPGTLRPPTARGETYRFTKGLEGGQL